MAGPSVKSEIQVSLRLTGQKEFESAIKQIGESADKLGKSFNNFTNAVGESAKKIALFTAAATAAGVAVGKLTKQNAEINDNLLDLSDATGVSTDKLQELMFAGQALGVSQDETTNGLLRFTDALGSLQRDGTGPLVSAFGKTDAAFLNQLKNTKDVAAAYDLFLNKAGKAAQGQEGFALVTDIVGKRLAVATVQLANGGKSFTEFTQDAVKSGAVLDKSTLKTSEELVNTFGRMDAIISATSRRITSAFEPSLIKLANTISDFLVNNQAKFEKFTKDLVARITKIVTDFVALIRGQNIVGVVDPIAARFAAFFKTLQQGFALIQKYVVPVVSTVVKYLDQFAQKLGFGQGAGLGVAGGILLLVNLFGGPFIAGLQLIITLFGTISAVLSAVIPTLTLLAGAFAALFTPVGAIIALIVASVANVLGFFDSFDKGATNTAKLLSDFFKNFSANLSILLVQFQAFIGKLKIYMEDIPGFIQNILLPGILSFFNSLPGLILAGFTALTAVIQKFFADRGKDIQNFIATAVPAVVQIATAVLQALPSIFAAIVNGAIALVQTLIATAGPQLVTLFTSIFNNLPTIINNVLTTAAALIKQFFATVGPQLVGLIAEAFKQLPVVLPAFINGALVLFKNLVVAFYPILRDLLLSILQNLPAIFTIIFEAILKTVVALVTQVGPVLLKGIGDILTKGIPQLIVDAVKAGIQLALGLISGFGQAITDTIFGRNVADGQPQQRAPALTVTKKAGGGLLTGPGTGTSDSIPVMGSNGEYVVKAKAVAKYGVGFMNALNRGAVSFQRFAEGGLIGATNALAGSVLTPVPVSAGNEGGGKQPMNLYLDGKKYPMSASQSVAGRLKKELRSSDFVKPAPKPRWHK